MASLMSPASNFRGPDMIGCKSRPFSALLVGYVLSTLVIVKVDGLKAAEAEVGTSQKRAGIRGEKRVLIRKEAHGKATRTHGSQPTFGGTPNEIYRNDPDPCVDYPRSFDPDNADPYSTGQAVCGSAGDSCNKDQYPEAEHRCCNCNGGGWYKLYINTQCTGDDDMPTSGQYDGRDIQNPMPFTDVQECMEACQALDLECSAITVINDNSDYAGQCYFRKGNLNYIHRYEDCFNSTCMQMKDQVSQEDAMRIEAERQRNLVPPEARYDNEHRLPICGSSAHAEQGLEAAEDYPCVQLPPPPVESQDTVVDQRDCFVKYQKE